MKTKKEYTAPNIEVLDYTMGEIMAAPQTVSLEKNDEEAATTGGD